MRRIYLIFLFIIFFPLVSCSNAGNTNNELYSSMVDYLDVSSVSTEYNSETDAQSGFNFSFMAAGKTGFYFWESNEYFRLMYMDTQSESCIPLCNKPDCNHDSKDCNAVIDISDILLSQQNIIYNEGFIYQIGADDEGNVNLYRFTADGSGYSKYMNLYKTDFSVPGDEDVKDIRLPEALIHRGYVYYIINNAEIPRVYRKKLGQDKEELIFENNGERANIYRIKAYGDLVLFQSGNFIDDSYSEIKAGIYGFNAKTNEAGMVVEGPYNDYLLKDGGMYYVSSDGIHRYDLKKNKDEKIIPCDGYSEFVIMNNLLYVFSDETALVKEYDLNGKEQRSSNIPDYGNGSDYYGGCSGYIFASALQDSKRIILCLNVGADELNWKKVWSY